MNDRSTNEGRFFESMRRFAAEVAKSDPVDAAGLEDLVKFYANPDRIADPLRDLPPSNAKKLLGMQRKVSPDLGDHPFFRRVADIAKERWSRQMQELFNGQTYLTQIEMGIGISPQDSPPPEVLKIIREARKTAPAYQAKARDPSWKGHPTSGASRPEASVFKKPNDLASIVAEFLKKNW